MLIMNNYGITFSNPEPARAGEARADRRLFLKHEANKKIPDARGEISRQVKRQVERREFKALKARCVMHRSGANTRSRSRGV